MTEIKAIINALKQHLKAAGLTYKQVAIRLDMSEPSIKRLLSSGNLSLKQLNQFCDILNISMADFIAKSEDSIPKLKQLSLEQESLLIADKKLLLVALCAINHWSIEAIREFYALSEAECVKHLLQLNHMNLLILQPGNRIRLLVDRDFEWIPNGPIWQYFFQQGLSDFLEFNPNSAEQAIVFNHGMLTPAAVVQLQLEMQKMRFKLTALHKESLQAPLSERHGTSLLMIARRWEPAFLAEFRRDRV